MARSREMYYKAAIEEYNRMFANTDIPIDTIAGLLVDGTYCLILRRKRSTFVGVDYQKKEEPGTPVTKHWITCLMLYSSPSKNMTAR